MCVPKCTCGDYRATLRNQLFNSATWVPGTELRSWHSVPIILTHREKYLTPAIHTASHVSTTIGNQRAKEKKKKKNPALVKLWSRGGRQDKIKSAIHEPVEREKSPDRRHRQILTMSAKDGAAAQ